MLARYSSRCRACDTAIRADIDTVTLIRDVNDEWWIHATCAVAAELGA